MRTRVIILIQVVFLIALVGFWYVESAKDVTPSSTADIVSESVTAEELRATTSEIADDSLGEADVIAQFFTPLTPLMIEDTSLLVSVAQTPAERARGLSGSPFLPAGIGKFFIFDGPGRWGIWMKEMQYSIDILWFDEAGQIVHIEEQVHPDTYPAVFTPTVDTYYVLEVPAGFVATNALTIGNRADLTNILQ